MHCVNHKIELAVKDALEAEGFTHVDNLYQSIFYILKISCAIKSDIQEAVNCSISYILPKLSGTRFVSHRIKALERVLNGLRSS